jgi:hypothetical protein
MTAETIVVLVGGDWIDCGIAIKRDIEIAMEGRRDLMRARDLGVGVGVVIEVKGMKGWEKTMSLKESAGKMDGNVIGLEGIDREIRIEVGVERGMVIEMRGVMESLIEMIAGDIEVEVAVHLGIEGEVGIDIELIMIDIVRMMIDLDLEAAIMIMVEDAVAVKRRMIALRYLIDFIANGKR